MSMCIVVSVDTILPLDFDGTLKVLKTLDASVKVRSRAHGTCIGRRLLC